MFLAVALGLMAAGALQDRSQGTGFMVFLAS
jgi:hypothetical protein